MPDFKVEEGCARPASMRDGYLDIVLANIMLLLACFIVSCDFHE